MATTAAFGIGPFLQCSFRDGRGQESSHGVLRRPVPKPLPLKVSLTKCWRHGPAPLRARSENGLEIGLQDDLVETPKSGYLPQADFYKVEAILRPWRLPHVASSFIKLGIRGVTVSDVRGFGSQGGSRERQAGSEFSEDSFVTKVKLEVVVSQDQVEIVIDTIIDQARTGEIGDGKIFVVPVADVIRVRTGERGLQAERMAGGRADILSQTATSSNNS